MASRKTKKIIIGLLVLFFTITGILTSYYLARQNQDNRSKAAPATTITASVSTNPSINTPFLIDITLETGTNQISAGDFYILFNPEYLEITQITKGPFFNLANIVSQNINPSGIVNLTTLAPPGSPLNGSGVAFSLSAIPKKLGNTIITFDETKTQIAAINEGSTSAISLFNDANFEIKNPTDQNQQVVDESNQDEQESNQETTTQSTTTSEETQEDQEDSNNNESQEPANQENNNSISESSESNQAIGGIETQPSSKTPPKNTTTPTYPKTTTSPYSNESVKNLNQIALETQNETNTNLPTTKKQTPNQTPLSPTTKTTTTINSQKTSPILAIIITSLISGLIALGIYFFIKKKNSSTIVTNLKPPSSPIPPTPTLTNTQSDQPSATPPSTTNPNSPISNPSQS